MYDRVLVPLDGSKLAECAFNHLKILNQSGIVKEITLLNVVWAEIPLADEFQRPVDITAIRSQVRAAAENYLADAQSRLAAKGITVKTEVIEGYKAAHAITDYAKDNGMGLVVMATHGYSGMKRVMLGSVALGVLHDCPVPVLLIRPEACRPE